LISFACRLVFIGKREGLYFLLQEKEKEIYFGLSRFIISVYEQQSTALFGR